MALLRNASTKCLKDLDASSAAAAANKLKGATIDYTYGPTPLVGADGTFANGAAAAQSDSSTNTIYLNLNYGWLNPTNVTFNTASGGSYTANWVAAVGAYVGDPSLTVTQYYELILIHETGHLLGVPQETTNAYDTAIFNDCIKGH
jgi:hypothetical protein